MRLSFTRCLILLAALVLTGATAVNCTVKEERREPGPLVVWFYSEPEAEHYYRILADDFREQTGLPLEIVFKEPYEMRAVLADPESIKGKVDLIEVDLFDLEQTAPHMEDLRPLMTQMGYHGFSEGAVQAGDIKGHQYFIPWRLSWPVVVASRKIRRPPGTWREFLKLAELHSGDVLVPGLDDREMFSFVCSVIWAHGGDPNKPFEDGMYEAFEFISKLSEFLRMESRAVRSSEIASQSKAARPALFIIWPEGLTKLILDGSLDMELKAGPLPCGSGKGCPVFSLGRYMGMPKGALHRKDAFNFIDFMLTPRFQQQMIFVQPWLPVRVSVWGDLGARREGYHALLLRNRNIRRPPRNLKKVEELLSGAGRRMLYEGSGALEELTRYRNAMLQE